MNFELGQELLRVETPRYGTKEPTVEKVRVIKLGRKWITVIAAEPHAHRFEMRFDKETMLGEGYGGGTRYFLSEQHRTDYAAATAAWVQTSAMLRASWVMPLDFTPEKGRQIAEILGRKWEEEANG